MRARLARIARTERGADRHFQDFHVPSSCALDYWRDRGVRAALEMQVTVTGELTHGRPGWTSNLQCSHKCCEAQRQDRRRRKIMIIVARRRRKCVRTLDITIFRITFQISVQQYLLDYG